MRVFRELSPVEETSFKAWARENYQPYTEIKGIWHPTVQAECVEINKEKEQSYENISRF